MFRKQSGVVTQIVNPIRIICQDLSKLLRFIITFSGLLTLCQPGGDEQLEQLVMSLTGGKTVQHPPLTWTLARANGSRGDRLPAGCQMIRTGSPAVDCNQTSSGLKLLFPHLKAPM